MIVIPKVTRFMCMTWHRDGFILAAAVLSLAVLLSSLLLLGFQVV